MKRFIVQPATRPLSGRVRVPGDKSIGHRALLLAALAEGESLVRGLSGGLDNRATAAALRAMGVSIEDGRDELGATARVGGVGLRGLRMAQAPLDCGNSGTTMRLLAGLLSAQPFGTRLVGDASLTRRPMQRIVGPLRARGAHIAGSGGARDDEVYPPLSIAPLLDDEALLGLEYDMPKASAQVKSALLLSGLYAEGPTAVREPMLSRDHTERMLAALGVPLETAGSVTMLDPSGWKRRWDPFEWIVPGDPSSAAFVLAAAVAVPGSEVEVHGVGTNPTRTGFIEALRLMQSPVGVVPKGDLAAGEGAGDLFPEGRTPQGRLIAGELLLRMIDEVPALSAVAAVGAGRTEIADAGELRVKESDRLRAMARVLDAFGVPVEERPDGLVIEGGRSLRGAHVASDGDHRVAMAAVVLALRADGPTWVDDVDCVDTSFPGFADTLRALGADIAVAEAGEGG